MSAEALHLLNTLFGFHSFRGRQEEVIDRVSSGADALVLMPTGGGKSASSPEFVGNISESRWGLCPQPPRI